ncbi:glycosyltransferase [Shewanella glacialipiscicola]|uniref:glycosyltransferase n=1 Tax=Shewanella glacialipiscicola TaxID=614069 RepID=UPI003D7BBE08
MKIYVSMLTIYENNLYGVGYFLKRFFIVNKSEIQRRCLIIFCWSDFDIQKFSGLDDSQMSVVRFPKCFKNPIMRIIIEQLVIPLLLKEKGVFYTPNNILPLFKRKKLKYVNTIHDMLPFESSNRFGFARKFYLRYFSSQSIRKSDKVITVSNYSKNKIQDEFNLSDNSVDVICNTIDARPLANIPRDSNQLLIIAGLSKDKRIDMAIEFIYKLINEEPGHANLQLKICGADLGYRASLQNKIESLEMNNNVQLLGYVDLEVKYDLLDSSQYLLMFGKGEGCGIPILEAHYSGLPVIMTNDSAMPEFATTGDYVINPWCYSSFKNVLNSRKDITKTPNNEYASDLHQRKLLKILDSLCR